MYAMGTIHYWRSTGIQKAIPRVVKYLSLNLFQKGIAGRLIRLEANTSVQKLWADALSTTIFLKFNPIRILLPLCEIITRRIMPSQASTRWLNHKNKYSTIISSWDSYFPKTLISVDIQKQGWRKVQQVAVAWQRSCSKVCLQHYRHR